MYLNEDLESLDNLILQLKNMDDDFYKVRIQLWRKHSDNPFEKEIEAGQLSDIINWLETARQVMGTITLVKDVIREFRDG